MKKLLFLALLCLPLMAAQAKTEKLTVQGSHGKLSAILQTPDLKNGEKCRMVILSHGFGGNKDEHQGMMKSFADTLQSLGIGTIRFDYNGHGESEGRFQDMTVQNEVEDLKCIYNYVAALPYTEDVSLLGHSQGGAVSSIAAGELGNKKVNRVVLLAPAAVLREDALRGNTMGKTYDPVNPPAEIPIWGKVILGGEYVRQARDLKIYDIACQFTGPVCIVHGTDDRVVPYSFGERYNREYKNSELHLIDLDDHGFSKHFNEMLKIAVDFLVKDMPETHVAPNIEYVMEIRAICDPAFVVGKTSHGTRVIIPITGGTFEGPGIKGTIIPGGADHQLVDPETGRVELEAIYSIKTDDGVYIHVRNCGLISEGGKYFRTAPKFEAPADSKYSWLNDAIFVCTPEGKDGYISLPIWKVN